MTEISNWPWDDGADVVVAGAGGSGLMAALTAAECGASVLVCTDSVQICETANLISDQSRHSASVETSVKHIRICFYLQT